MMYNVLRLLAVADVLQKGHVLYCDNFYTSVELFEHLSLLGTMACGTVRINRQGLPEDIMRKRPQGLHPERGSCVMRQKGPLLAIAWQDRRVVTLLTTAHDNRMDEVPRIQRVIDRIYRNITSRFLTICPSA